MNHLDRKNYLGASEAAAAIGMNPWRTPLDLWTEKTGQSEPFHGNEKTMWGQILEEPILRHLAEQTGLKIHRNSTVYRSQEHPFMAATPDGKVVKEPIGVEIKTGGFFTRSEWGESGTDQVPDAYLVQVMHQAIVCKFQSVLLAVLLGGQDFRFYQIKFDQELSELVIKKEAEFWQHVVDKTPPPPQTLGDIASLYPSDSGKSIEATAEVFDLIDKLKAVKSRMAEQKATSDDLEIRLKSFIADNSFLVDIDGKPLATWKSQSSSRIDTSALKKSEPAIAEKFTKTAESRVLRIK